MKTVWTKGMKSEAEKEEMRADFVAAAALRLRAIQLMQEKIEAARAVSLAKDAYANPNWAYLQADAVGYQRALSEIISIFES